MRCYQRLKWNSFIDDFLLPFFSSPLFTTHLSSSDFRTAITFNENNIKEWKRVIHHKNPWITTRPVIIEISVETRAVNALLCWFQAIVVCTQQSLEKPNGAGARSVDLYHVSTTLKRELSRLHPITKESPSRGEIREFFSCSRNAPSSLAINVLLSKLKCFRQCYQIG